LNYDAKLIQEASGDMGVLLIRELEPDKRLLLHMIGDRRWIDIVLINSLRPKPQYFLGFRDGWAWEKFDVKVFPLLSKPVVCHVGFDVDFLNQQIAQLDWRDGFAELDL